MLNSKTNLLRYGLCSLLLLATTPSFSNQWLTRLTTQVRQKLPSWLGGSSPILAKDHTGIATVPYTSAAPVSLSATIPARVTPTPTPQPALLTKPTSANQPAPVFTLLAQTHKQRITQLHQEILNEEAKLKHRPGYRLLEQHYLGELADLERAAAEHPKLAILLADDITFAQQKLTRCQTQIAKSNQRVQELQRSLQALQAAMSPVADSMLRDAR